MHSNKQSKTSNRNCLILCDTYVGAADKCNDSCNCIGEGDESSFSETNMASKCIGDGTSVSEASVEICNQLIVDVPQIHVSRRMHSRSLINQQSIDAQLSSHVEAIESQTCQEEFDEGMHDGSEEKIHAN